MPTVSDAIVIGRPPRDVFAALADPKIQMTYDGAMMLSCEQVTPGPIAQGTRFRGSFKGMGTVEYTYAEFVPDRLIEHTFQLPVGQGRHRFEFVPEGAGTRLTQIAHAELNLLGRVVWPLMMRRKIEDRVRSLNGLVKQHVEAQPSASARA